MTCTESLKQDILKSSQQDVHRNNCIFLFSRTNDRFLTETCTAWCQLIRQGFSSALCLEYCAMIVYGFCICLIHLLVRNFHFFLVQRFRLQTIENLL